MQKNANNNQNAVAGDFFAAMCIIYLHNIIQKHVKQACAAEMAVRYAALSACVIVPVIR